MWTRPLTTGRPLKDHGWSVNFNQKVDTDQDVISERILDNLSCGIANALDGSEDDAVWEEENEETEDAEEIIDNEFKTGGESEEGE